MRKVIIAIIFISSCCGAAAQPLTASLDSLINSRLAGVAPGCAVLIAKNGKIIYEKGFGKADLELNVRMKPDMIFRLGSITKQYTAIAILQLVEQGKISLQDSIQKFIKDFPNKGHTITIENLLTHTSGIIDYESLDMKIPKVYRLDFPPRQFVDSLEHHPLVFTPGSKFSYCNSNYFLLGYIIELITGKSYAEYMQQHVFTPIGLTNTYYDDEKQVIPNRVRGYGKWNNGKYENADYIGISQVYAAGALVSNVEDMFKWHQALYSYKLVRKETLEKAFTTYKLADGTLSGYGYGWFIKDQNGEKSIEHAGGIDGFQSDEVYLPGQDIFIATLYNSLNNGGDDMSFMLLSNDIVTLAMGKALAKEVNVADVILQQYVGVYQFDAAHSAMITLENGQLQMEALAGGLPKSPLFAESDNKFMLKVVKAEIEFVKDAQGNVIRLIAHVNGQDQVCKKVK
ncbi:MAG TPA: serine hydrolase [Mucilaginibacter sp.]|nr:serine hydrolase [Mucilaginibacter sp.]